MSPHQDEFRSSRGFTLVEALVSLAVLTVGLVPAFIQASNALVLAGSVRNSLVASSLAQEGVEVVRAMRDRNWFTSVPFDTGLTACTTGCRVQWDSPTVLPLAGNPLLRSDATSGLYQYSTGTNTLFKRQITITPVGNHELKVVAKVEWQERKVAKSFQLEYHVYNWLQ